jgi:dolichyl-phosphate beta-glucosyltransferase
LISWVIPAYNEENRIVKTIVGVTKELQGLDYEIIVSDDGSSDGTVDLLKGIGLDHLVVVENEHRGPGNALRQGLLRSKGEVVVLSLADIVVPRVDIETYLTMVKYYDFLQLSKNLPSSKVENRSFKREVYSRIFHFFERRLLSLPYGDTGAVKIIKGEIARELGAAAKEDSFMYNVELIYLAQTSGKIRVKETYWDVDLEGKYAVHGSRVASLEGWRLLMELFRFSRRQKKPKPTEAMG